MKKKYLIVFIILCLLLTGCKDQVKEVKKTIDFQNISSKNGFIVKDNKAFYAENNYIKEAYIATYQDQITIEMAVYDTIDSAKKVQEDQIDHFNLLKNAGAGGEKKIKGANFYKYSLVSNNYYMVSSRVDNTLIFCKTLFTNKERVETILDELGY